MTNEERNKSFNQQGPTAAKRAAIDLPATMPYT